MSAVTVTVVVTDSTGGKAQATAAATVGGYGRTPYGRTYGR
jgi:hypothetical protein